VVTRQDIRTNFGAERGKRLFGKLRRSVETVSQATALPGSGTTAPRYLLQLFTRLEPERYMSHNETRHVGGVIQKL
jgi:hypothetical protein